MRCWGDSCFSCGELDARGSHPDPELGHPHPWSRRYHLRFLLPSAQAGFTIILPLTNGFGVSLSLFTTGEVSVQQQFPLERRLALGTIPFHAIFIILVLKTAQLLLQDTPVLSSIDNASLPALISRFH